MTEAVLRQGAAVAAPSTAQVGRIASVDILRGVVMALMALDHVRDFFHAQAVQFDPLDLEQTYPVLFATRWVTHFCAPVFVFLSGVSAYLQSARKTRSELSRFLLTRGLWLVLMELTVIGFGWSFRVDFLFLQVIWAIGWSMVALSALLWLGWRGVLAIGLVIVAGHHLLAPVQPQQFGAWAPLWMALNRPGPILAGGELAGFFAYPILPWMGIMALGYGLGPVFRREAAERRRTLWAIGGAMVTLFVVLRLADGFGDPNHWEAQRTFAVTAMDWLSTTKNPPSLLYVCMTIGPALLVLPLLDRVKGWAAEPWVSFGAVPFFFYILHVYLAHALGAAYTVAAGYSVWGVADLFLGVSERLQGWGVSLATTYVVWLLVLALLYPLCRWFAALKRRRRDWWLSYL